MKYILAIYLAIFFGCNNSKVNATEISPVIKLQNSIKVNAKTHQDLTLTLKDSKNYSKAKNFIRKSKLIWSGFKKGNNSTTIIFIKVPNGKIGFWMRRLRSSNLFSSIKLNNQNTISRLNTNYKNTFIKLKKTRCSGDCETFEAIFLNDGRVIFNGIANVRFKGKKTFTLTSNQLKKVKRLFLKTNFKKYRYSFSRNGSSGFSSTFITYQNKQVEVKLWKNAPKELAIANEYLEMILVGKRLLK